MPKGGICQISHIQLHEASKKIRPEGNCELQSHKNSVHAHLFTFLCVKLRLQTHFQMRVLNIKEGNTRRKRLPRGL